MEQTQPVYAGFWLRFVAHMIDMIIIGIVSFVILIPLLGVLGLAAFMGNSHEAFDGETPGFIVAMVSTYLVFGLAILACSWLYFALMESSAKGGTLGKMAIGIMVTDMTGNRISFGRATGRYFAKILSQMILMIGFLMAGFTQQKQALHDILAGCLVVRSR